MKKRIHLCFLVLMPLLNWAQPTIDRFEPPFWWVGMSNPSLQIMVYGEQLSGLKPMIDYDGVQIQRVIQVENDNYLFIDLTIAAHTAPGELLIQFQNSAGKVVNKITYPLKERKQDAANQMGYDNSDVMYLITPDRFANGDATNDNIAGMPDSLNRANKWGRHGGDLQGIDQHLDYLADLGFTAIWLNPILENNQKEFSYHGYSTTDFYRVDPRYGTNEDYQALSKKANAKGIKIIMDMIMNHCGSEHWWMKDLPAQDWINHTDSFVKTNHRRTTLRDPYASKYDRDQFANGWFVKTMPDLNQRNPLMATYLIQNTIWWIEFVGLSGIRMDTYPYSDHQFMSDWTCAVMNEYPNFNICGEEWSINPAVLAYWQAGKNNPDGYTSCLPGLLDFPLQHALKEALLMEESWNDGMIDLYDMLSNDFQYTDPYKHVIFPDNHDMSRIYTQLNDDFDLLKLAMTYFATMRGTPQFYYGTEILMSNTGDNSHGNIRSDFPGGWAGDTTNARTNNGLSEIQIQAKAFTKKLLNWRKTASAIHDGKLVHFIPENGVYVYFRFNDTQKVMVVLNKTAEEQEVKLTPFREVLPAGAKGKDILSDEHFHLKETLTIGAKQPLIIEIQ